MNCFVFTSYTFIPWEFGKRAQLGRNATGLWTHILTAHGYLMQRCLSALLSSFLARSSITVIHLLELMIFATLFARCCYADDGYTDHIQNMRCICQSMLMGIGGERQ
jgi:hypothetical protein